MSWVTEGNIFEQFGAWRTRWQVETLVDKPGYPAHARLVSADGRQETKLIAISALQDRAKFRLIQPVNSDQAAEN